MLSSDEIREVVKVMIDQKVDTPQELDRAMAHVPNWHLLRSMTLAQLTSALSTMSLFDAIQFVHLLK